MFKIRIRPSAIGAGALALALVLSVVPGAGAASSHKPKGSSLVFAEFNPFSGPDAAFGPEMVVACDAAVLLINQDGGILGHPGTCKGFDTHGDPADAVPAAEQMIATTSGLAGVIGPSSDEALATVPILNRADVPMFADTGQAAFDKTTDTYFWRVSPADDVKGYAMAIWAHKKGYTRAAVVFGNDVGSQSNVPTLVHAFELLGGKVVSNLRVALDATSYRTEIESMLATHPQVIFTEEDPATAATFLSELASLDHSKLLPVVGSEVTLEAPWIQAVSRRRLEAPQAVPRRGAALRTTKRPGLQDLRHGAVCHQGGVEAQPADVRHRSVRDGLLRLGEHHGARHDQGSLDVAGHVQQVHHHGD